MNSKIKPVLLGADMNCYSVARAFHEAFGVTTKAFGRYPMGDTKYSRIVEFEANEKADQDAVMLDLLADYAAAHPEETKILLGCTDDYAAMLIRNRDALSQNYVVPYIGAALMEKLVSKDSFYRMCDEYGIDYPSTVVLAKEDDAKAVFAAWAYGWPVIIKPSSSIAYWKHPFDGMKKVYTAKNAEEACGICKTIFGSGYPDTIIVQDMIPGADSEMRVLTAYCDKNAKVKMMCLGHVLLEEHTPRAIGNHAAILTEYDRPLMDKLAHFLEDIGYTGFANFDIKHDTRDGSFRVFEINLRQGRSNHYVTGAGLNIAKYLVEDRVRCKDLGPALFYEGESFWHSIPTPIVRDYTADRALAARAVQLAAEKKDSMPFNYAFDLRLNPLRWLYLKEHYRRYYKKYATYCEKPLA